MPCFLVACSTVPKSSLESSPEQSISDQITTVDQAVKVSTVVGSLIDQAMEQDKIGELQRAEDSLDRAIRIAPRFPESYFRLAELYYKQGKYIQARSLAQKSLSLGADGIIREQALLLVTKASAAQL